MKSPASIILLALLLFGAGNVSAVAREGDILKIADALVDEAEELADDVREEMEEDEERTGTMVRGGLWEAATALKYSAGRFQNDIRRGRDRAAWAGSLDDVERHLRRVRTGLTGRPYDRDLFEQAWRVEGLILAVRGGRVDRRDRRDEGESPRREAVAGTPVHDAGVAPAATGPAIGFGDRGVARANSIAHRHLNRSHGIRHENMRTLDIRERGGRHLVEIRDGTRKFLLEIDVPSGAVVSEKIKSL
jgi:hypothetical protein